jgi:predicted RNase H-like nuclease (RuvC/YqgF family)
MITKCGFFFGLAVGASLFAATARAQDSPSLGDVVRQQRKQKEQSKTAPGKVITNEEIPEHPGSTPEVTHDNDTWLPAPSLGSNDSAEHLKSRFRAQKSQIAYLQKRIDEMNKSIRFTQTNCTNGCLQWNERQNRKLQEVERMQIQLQEQKNALDQMQESARKRGYGNSVYDP